MACQHQQIPGCFLPWTPGPAGPRTRETPPEQITFFVVSNATDRWSYPLVMSKYLLKKAIEIVDLPIKNGGSFHSYVSLPEGKQNLRNHCSKCLPANEGFPACVSLKSQVSCTHTSMYIILCVLVCIYIYIIKVYVLYRMIMYGKIHHLKMIPWGNHGISWPFHVYHTGSFTLAYKYGRTAPQGICSPKTKISESVQFNIHYHNITLWHMQFWKAKAHPLRQNSNGTS